MKESLNKKNSTIRVLMIISGLSFSDGVASFAMNYFRKVDRDRVHIDFAVLKDYVGYKEEVESAGSKVFVLPPIKHFFKHFSECRLILKEGQYDIIHDNSLILTIPLMICAKYARIPVRILHSHSSKLGETPWKAFRNKLFLPVLKRQMTEACACSTLAGKTMFGNRQFAVLPNVIAVDKFAYDSTVRDNIRRRMCANDKVVIGTVGRLSPPKNPFFAMDVFAKLHKEMPNTEYWWVGTGAIDNDVKAYVKRMGIEDCVFFLGARSDVCDLYQGMDVLFMPSLFEGLPVTGIEAQAAGLPLVVSEAVTKEMVYTDLVKYVSLNETADKWVKALNEQTRKSFERENYIQYARVSLFSDINAGTNLIRLYTELINKVEEPKRGEC